MSNQEEHPLVELVNFVTDKRREVRLIALENIAASTTDKVNFNVLKKTRLIRYLARMIGDSDNQISRAVVPTLINLSEDPVFVKQMLAQNVVSRVVDAILDNSGIQHLYVVLLCNITRDDAGSRKLLQANTPLFGFYISKLMELLDSDDFEAYNWISSIISNITQVAQGRELMLDPERGYIEKILGYIEHEDLTIRRGIVGALKNCLFDYDCHMRLIDNHDILTKILWPLRGPEQYKQGELEDLPEKLKYVEEDKQREEDEEVRSILIECLILLTSTQYGRETMRSVSVYQILKYYDAVEENDTICDRIFSLVNVLEGLTEDPNRSVTFDPLESSKSNFQSAPIGEEQIVPSVSSTPSKRSDYDEFGEVVEVI